ncbi:MAG: DUF5684 domain-containing protein [Patescibacteria group bacterium]
MLNEQELQNAIEEALRQSGDVDLSATTGITDTYSWLGGYGSGLATTWSWILTLVIVAAQWAIFEKAKQPGWAAIIPIYGTLIFLKIANRPWWWIFLFLIPIVGLVYGIMASHQISKAFGKGTGFTVGLVLLPFVFYPILAFSSDKYQKPA